MSLIQRLAPVFVSALLVTGCTGGGGGQQQGEFHSDPESLNFGFTEVNAATDAAPLTLINEGDSDVEIQGLAFSEGAADVFLLFATITELPYVLEPGDDKEISVYFLPTSSGIFEGSLDLALGSEEDDVFSIPVGGCSTTPDCTVEVGDDDDDDDSVGDDDDDSVSGDGDISVSPAAVNFGQVAMNQQPSEVVVISNVGGGPLDVESVSLSGPDSALFSLGSFSGGTLQPNGAPVNLSLIFDASTASLGAKSATLVIESDDPDEGTLSVALTATVVEDCGACTPEITIIGATDLGDPLGSGTNVIYLQVTTGTIDVTVRNDGFGTANITQVTEGGQLIPDNPSIQYTSGAPLSLDSGEEGELHFAVGIEGCEVVNFDGAYAFTMGTIAGTDLFALFGCLGGDSLPFP